MVKKYSWDDVKLFEIMLNKQLAKYEITWDEIYEMGEKFEGVIWYQYFTHTEKENQEWKDWCLNFLRKHAIPKYPDWKLKSEIALFDLCYGLKLV